MHVQAVDSFSRMSYLATSHALIIAFFEWRELTQVFWSDPEWLNQLGIIMNSWCLVNHMHTKMSVCRVTRAKTSYMGHEAPDEHSSRPKIGDLGRSFASPPTYNRHFIWPDHPFRHLTWPLNLLHLFLFIQKHPAPNPVFFWVVELKF